MGLGQGVNQIVQQKYQRGLLKQALGNVSQTAQQGQSPLETTLALLEATAGIPGSEKYVGQVLPLVLQEAKLGRAFPGQGVASQGSQEQTAGAPNTQQSENSQPSSSFAAPGPFNVMTPQDMESEAQRYAHAVQDPNAYQMRYSQLQNQNQNATSQRQALEDAALKADVKPEELPRFMLVNSHLNPRNPSEWAQQGIRNYNKIKSNDQKIETAFIPGLGSGLLGRDRKQTLKRIEPSVKSNVEAGLEQETRNYLADQYLSPTEIEELIHPLTPQKEKAIKALPGGVFGKQPSTLTKFSPTISYEEALEKAPQELAQMQHNLANFFMKNVDDDTSLLVLRDKLWQDKNYDWRQIGPAIREAESRGLKLSTPQSTEMTEIETQAPRQSLPDLFQSLDRVVQFFRGNK